MAARSEHTGYIRSLPAEFIVDKGPAATSACRDGIVNNANHLADECTQVRGSVTLKAGGYYPELGAIVDTFYPPFGLLPIEMPLQVRADGRSVLIVPHLRAAVSTGTLTIRVFLSLYGTTAATATHVPAVSDSCSEVTTASTTGADLAPDPIFLSADEYEPLRMLRADRSLPGRRVASLHGDAAETPGTVTVPTAFLHVRWKWSVAATPKFFGLSWREYIDG